MAGRVVHIVGARPQFVKLAPVLAALDAAGKISSRIVHTGQHYDETMSERFFDELAIRAPDINLGVGSGSHAAQTGAIMVGVERDLAESRPDAVLVYGDTNSTLAGALAAAKSQCPVVHLEAGVRARDFNTPEEINRVATDRISSLLLAVSESSAANLRREGLPESQIAVVGDVMYDVALSIGRRAAADSTILDRLGVTPGAYLLATVHRAGNTDDPGRLDAIFRGLAQAGEIWPVIMPLHPRTRKALDAAGLTDSIAGRLRLIEPVGYLDMARLTAAARLVVSDSGGLPKEAFFHGVRSVLLRADALWPELVELGWSDLLPAGSAEDVAAGILGALEAPPGREGFPYGKGDAGPRVADAVARLLEV